MSAERVGVVDADGSHLSSSTLRVLLVEDDEGDAFLVRELLLDAGSQVELLRARSVSEASAVLPGDVDCVLLDLGLPDASGLDALTRRSRARAEHRGPGADRSVRRVPRHRGGRRRRPGLPRQGQHRRSAAHAGDPLRGRAQARRRVVATAVTRRRHGPRRTRDWNAVCCRSRCCAPGSSRSIARYRPGRHQSLLGGDFFDVVECDDGSVFGLIGDVAGHGPDEAALGVCLRIAWRTLVLSGTDPDRIFPIMDAVLVSERSTDEVFATVAMVRVDPSAGRLRIWRAGHPLPLVVEGSSRPAGPGGRCRRRPRRPRRRPLARCRAPGRRRRTARSLLFTDGLIEGYDGQAPGRRLGEAGLYALIEGLLERGLGGDELLDALLADVRERNGGELTDDVAVVLLSWQGR